MIQQVIEQYNDRNALYQNGLTNHLNMGLLALYKMGASEKRLHEFATTYIDYKNLEPAEPLKINISDENFTEHMGLNEHYTGFVQFFKRAFEQDEPERVFRKYVNQLVPGFPGGAFHGLIRLAYAYELESTDELAKALAYMADCYMPLSIASETYPIKAPMEAFQVLAANAHFQEKDFTRSLITGRMLDVAEDKHAQALLHDMPSAAYTSERLNELSVQLYGMTENFTMLHGLTSTHALAVLEPILDDYVQALRLHWRHLQIAYLSTGCTPVQPLPEEPVTASWDQLFDRTIQANDVHTIKLVYSLFDQSQRRNDKSDDLYRRLALRKLDGQ